VESTDEVKLIIGDGIQVVRDGKCVYAARPNIHKTFFDQLPLSGTQRDTLRCGWDFAMKESSALPENGWALVSNEKLVYFSDGSGEKGHREDAPDGR
jgi:hypothetical protein